MAFCTSSCDDCPYWVHLVESKHAISFHSCYHCGFSDCCYFHIQQVSVFTMLSLWIFRQLFLSHTAGVRFHHVITVDFQTAVPFTYSRCPFSPCYHCGFSDCCSFHIQQVSVFAMLSLWVFRLLYLSHTAGVRYHHVISEDFLTAVTFTYSRCPLSPCYLCGFSDCCTFHTQQVSVITMLSLWIFRLLLLSHTAGVRYHHVITVGDNSVMTR